MSIPAEHSSLAGNGGLNMSSQREIIGAKRNKRTCSHWWSTVCIDAQADRSSTQCRTIILVLVSEEQEHVLWGVVGVEF